MENPEFNWPFTSQALTETVNELDHQWGLFADMGYSPGEGVASTVVEIAIVGDEIRVLPAKKRGEEPTGRQGQAEKSIFMEIPYFPQQSIITPKDLQDWEKKANRIVKPKTLAESLAERLEVQRLDHDLTLEYIRVGAVKGLIKDGAGNTLYNLFNEFDVTKKTIDFELDVSTTNVLDKCGQVVTHVRKNLKGEIMTHVEMPVSSAFFNTLTGHPNVEKFWLQTEQAQALAQPVWQQYGRRFRFGGIEFQEYDATVSLHNGSSDDMVAEGYGHAFPAGTRSAYQTYFAPPYHVEHANESGLEIFISQEMLKHGKGVEIESQSSPLSVFRRPAALVEGVQY